MPRKSSCRIAALSAAWLVLTATAFGQSQNATLDGTVKDMTGAAIPQAQVTVAAAERQFSSTVQTDNEGRFTFPNLAPGAYDLTITAKGFRTYIQKSIQLLANQSAGVDASLEVGDASTKIEVTANAALLNLDNGTQQEGVPPQIVN